MEARHPALHFTICAGAAEAAQGADIVVTAIPIVVDPRPELDAGMLEKGALEVYAYITHGVLSGGAVARISASRLKELVLTDTIQPTEAVRVAKNIRVVSIAPLIGEAIARTANEESVSSLFD